MSWFNLDGSFTYQATASCETSTFDLLPNCDDKTWGPRLKLLLFRHSSTLFYPEIHCQWSQITKKNCIKTLGGLDTKSSISAFLLLIVSFAWATMCVSPFLGDKTKAILIVFPGWKAEQLSLLFLSIRLFYQFLLGIDLLPAIMILYPIPRFPHFLQDSLFPTFHMSQKKKHGLRVAICCWSSAAVFSAVCTFWA